jgi:hypothetical protein
MTAALAAVPARALRPVPWRRLGWVAWRRYRPALIATAALLGLLALFFVVRGLQMRHAYAAVQECGTSTAANCRFAFGNFHDTYGNAGPVGALMVFVPGLIGAFIGAPLLARELETGTYRYAWTQGVGRLRWLLALIIPGALGAAAVAGAFGLLISWYNQPLVATGIVQRLHETVFPVTGVAIAAWTLLAYGLGVTAGVVIRRVVPAIIAGLAAWTGLAFLGAHARQFDYQAPIASSRLQFDSRNLQVGQWWTHGANPAHVGQGQLNQVLQAAGAPTFTGGSVEAKPGGPTIDPVQYLLHHGYLQWTAYQPANRYWTFQGIEAAWLVVLSLLLLTATVWFVRRRNV